MPHFLAKRGVRSACLFEERCPLTRRQIQRLLENLVNLMEAFGSHLEFGCSILSCINWDRQVTEIIKSLQGKIAVVTGASRGAGRGIALALGDAGATVYVTGRSVSPHFSHAFA